MPVLRSRQVDSSLARCLRCGELAMITVVETRYARRWGQVFDRGFDAAPARTARCSACATTYPVRRTDVTARPAAVRGTSDDASGREWAYGRRAEDEIPTRC